LELKSAKPKPYPKVLNTLGDHVKKKRLDLGLLRNDVAAQIRVHPTTIGNWEHNRTTPDLHLIPRIIEFLGYVPYSTPEGFPDWLRTARRALGLSQKQLCECLSVDESTVRQWEKGKARPGEKSLKALKVFFGAQLTEPAGEEFL
jgi:ribosome-binding protein aMBF1 (putative translation factor)